MQLLKRIRSAIDEVPNLDAEYRFLASIAPEDLKRADEDVREREAKWKKVCEALEMVARRHGATEMDVELITEFVAAVGAQTADFDSLLESLSFARSPRARKDGQIQKARRNMIRIEELRETLSSDASARRYILSISERAEELVKQRAHIFSEILNIKGTRLWRGSNQSEAPLSRIRRTLESVNLAGDLGEKLLVATNWVRQLVGAE